MDEKRIQQPRPRDNYKAWEDPLYNDLRRIFSRSTLRTVLTHSSFYEKEGKGNSRYIFAGMFVFKGQVADVLYQYFSGDGTRLQHILGNLFGKERLERMYDDWKLGQFVRAGENFDILSHKHIFVYAIFGYVSTLSEDLRGWFISKYILADDVKHLFTHRKRNKDIISQADEITRQIDGRRLSLEMEVLEDGRHRAKAVLSDGTIVETDMIVLYSVDNAQEVLWEESLHQWQYHNNILNGARQTSTIVACEEVQADIIQALVGYAEGTRWTSITGRAASDSGFREMAERAFNKETGFYDTDIIMEYINSSQGIITDKDWNYNWECVLNMFVGQPFSQTNGNNGY